MLSRKTAGQYPGASRWHWAKAIKNGKGTVWAERRGRVSKVEQARWHEKKEELEESRENEGFCMQWSRFTLSSRVGGATDPSEVAFSQWLHGGTALLKHRKCTLQSRSVTSIHGNRHGHTTHIGSKLGNHSVRSFPYCRIIFVMFASVISFQLL